MTFLKKYGQPLVYGIIEPIINLAVRLGITPNMVTTMGLLINIGAAAFLIVAGRVGERNDHSWVGWWGIVLLVAGLFDMMDGRLARVGKMSSTFGALYDSVLDRYSELFMFLGICYYFVAHDYFLSSISAFIAMIGSIMVSYTRARAEGLGIDCSVGIMQRPERILLIGISAILCGMTSHFFGGDFKMEVDWLPIPLFEPIIVFTLPIFILAILANITAIRRLLHSKKQLEG